MTSQCFWLIWVTSNRKRWRGKHFNTSFCVSSCPACVPNCRSRPRWTPLSSWKHWLATSWTWSSITKTTEHLRWEVTNITVSVVARGRGRKGQLVWSWCGSAADLVSPGSVAGSYEESCGQQKLFRENNKPAVFKRGRPRGAEGEL